MCACADRVHQLALNDDERFLVLFFPILCMVLYVQRQEKEKERERIVFNGKEKETERERENSQLLLFDGQSTDDKDYAIVFSLMFWSDAYLYSFIRKEI
jgi:hypothetical protein